MSEKTDHAARQDKHEAIWELLPWYANGTLSAQENMRVERHLAACPLCQQELARCRHLSAAAKAMEEKAWSPSPRHFAQVLAHVDEAEAIQKATVQASRPLLARLRAWFSVTPRPMQWAFAVLGALVLALAGGLLLKTTGPTSMYQTLSRPGEPVAADRAQLHVAFAEDVTGKELRDLLQGINAQIVRGPSPMGVYTIQLPFAATAQERVTQVLAIVRAHPKVRLAQPVEDRSSP